MLLTVIPLVAVLSQLCVTAEENADANVRIKLIRYENLDAKLADGFFCETDFNNKKIADCDPIFAFEVMREGGEGDLLFSYRQSNHFNRGTVFNFGAQIGEMVNPITIDVQMQHPHHIFLKVTVDDYDPSGKNKPMDIFVFMLQPSLKAQNVTLVSPATKHSLTISYRFTCKTNYYGPMCNKLCIGKNDDTNGHYRCSADGDKVCLEGWANVESDCKVPAWCIWC